MGFGTVYIGIHSQSAALLVVAFLAVRCPRSPLADVQSVTSIAHRRLIAGAFDIHSIVASAFGQCRPALIEADRREELAAGQACFSGFGTRYPPDFPSGRFLTSLVPTAARVQNWGAFQ